MALSKTHATNLLLALLRKNEGMSTDEIVKGWEKILPGSFCE